MPDQRKQTAPTGLSALSVLGVQLGRHTGTYLLSAGIGLALALVQVGIVTRYLDPAEFGRLALLLFLAAMLTVLYSLGSLQGTFARVFGSSGEEEADDAGEEAASGKKREALGAGLILIAGVSTLGTILLAPLAPSLAGLLIGDRGESHLVLLALVSGALGAVWRLLQNIPRMERRPRRYLLLASARPILVLAAVTSLVVTGGGIDGVMIGIAAGSAAALVFGLFANRESWALSLDLPEAGRIMRRGAFLIPIILSYWIVQNADLFALSRYVSDEDVGLYRLAGRLASIVSYATSAYFLAWLPMRRGMAFKAASEERGAELEGTLLRYLLILCAGLLLAMTVGADLLVQIAPPEYADAAPLVPLLGGAFVAHALLVAVYRSSSFPDRRKTYVSVVVASVGLFVIAAMALMPRFGAYGAAAAVMASFSPGAAWIAFRSQFGPTPIALEGRRVLALAAVTAIALIAARASADLPGTTSTAAHVGILLVYPVLLVASGAVPLSDLKSLRRVGGILVRRPGILDVRSALEQVDDRDLVALRASAVHGRGLEALGEALGEHPVALARRMVGALRTLAGTPGETGRDGAIGLHLFSRATVADRDSVGRRLLDAGATAEDIGRLELALEELTAIRRDSWPPQVVSEAEALSARCRDDGEDGIAPILRAELRSSSRSRTKELLERERPYGEHLRYVLHQPDGDSRCLLVGLSSARPDTVDRYSYVGALTRKSCPTLFVRMAGPGYYLGLGGEREIGDELEGLVAEVSRELGLEMRQVIGCGGSGAGVAVTVMACRIGLPHVVVGAPVFAAGDFLLGTAARSVRRRIALEVAGADDDDARDRLNRAVLDPLENPAAPIELHVLISEQDQMFQFCLPPLREAMAKTDRVSLDLTMADYVGHGAHREHFRPYLRDKVDELTRAMDDRDGVASAHRAST